MDFFGKVELAADALLPDGFADPSAMVALGRPASGVADVPVEAADVCSVVPLILDAALVEVASAALALAVVPAAPIGAATLILPMVPEAWMFEPLVSVGDVEVAALLSLHACSVSDKKTQPATHPLL